MKKLLSHYSKNIGLFYFRDNSGNEIDCIIEDQFNRTVYLVETKHSATPKPFFAEKMQTLLRLTQNAVLPFTNVYGKIVYQGKEDIVTYDVQFIQYTKFLHDFENSIAQSSQ